jgi:hypothetical protein
VRSRSAIARARRVAVVGQAQRRAAPRAGPARARGRPRSRRRRSPRGSSHAP